MSLVGTGSPQNEALKGIVCGLIYGFSTPLIGHPIDSIKTRMQADAIYARSGAWSTCVGILKNEGIMGLYRGLLPPLIGSSIFRSVQFSVYAFCQSHSRDVAWLRAEIPFSFGMETRVITSGFVASAARAVIETPLELIKVRRQMGLTWHEAPTVFQAIASPVREIRALYRGFGVSLLRTWGLMGSFFIFVDILERKHVDLLKVPFWGAWVKGAVCSAAAWLVVWPFEVIKNQIQAERGGTTNAIDRIRNVIDKRGGVLGLYRGIGPGLLRALVANGASMVMFSHCTACFDEGRFIIPKLT
jgi:solute carrier family 25 carnitine/acylcarnitine transporter 20/29